jgi:hypothetical protein
VFTLDHLCEVFVCIGLLAGNPPVINLFGLGLSRSRVQHCDTASWVEGEGGGVGGHIAPKSFQNVTQPAVRVGIGLLLSVFRCEGRL